MYRKSSFRPNQKANIKSLVRYNVKGQPEFSEKTEVGVSIIRFENDLAESSIRTDKSGSKSRAEESTYIGRILVEPKAEFEVGDLLELNRVVWKIDSKFPRFDQAGFLSHYQVDLVTWA